MPKIPFVTFNNGNKFPQFGLGTWRSLPGEVTEAVKVAIDAGYRHIDCAFIYGNELEIGVAIKAKIDDETVKREDLYITSKLWNTFHSKELVLPCIKESLKNLGVSYLDLYLIHWPHGYEEGGELFPRNEDTKIRYSDVDYIESWEGMEEAFKLGLIKNIGVSNFNKDQVERIITNGTIKPVVNQVECHPYLNQSKLLEYLKSKDIVMTSYSPLGSPQRPWAKPEDVVLLEDPKLVTLAEKYNKTVAHVLIRFQLQRGIICIPKSVTKSRIDSNIQVFDFELSEEDMETIKSFHCNGRFLKLEWNNDHVHFPFNAEF